MAHVHLAIVQRSVAQELLAGTKRIESRFYRQRRAPVGRIKPGDTVLFKVSGGELLGKSQVVCVIEFNDLNSTALRRLRQLYNADIRASSRYWADKRRSRYGVLIWLEPLATVDSRLTFPRQHGAGWVILDPPGPTFAKRGVGRTDERAILAGLPNSAAGSSVRVSN